MKIVIDTNVLLSAMIKDSTTRRIIVNSGFDCYYPEISFHEVRKYKGLVIRKTKLTEEEYDKLYKELGDIIESQYWYYKTFEVNELPWRLNLPYANFNVAINKEGVLEVDAYYGDMDVSAGGSASLPVVDGFISIADRPTVLTFNGGEHASGLWSGRGDISVKLK